MLSHYLFSLTQINLFEDRLFRAGAASLFASLLVFLGMPGYIAMLKGDQDESGLVDMANYIARFAIVANPPKHANQ